MKNKEYKSGMEKFSSCGIKYLVGQTEVKYKKLNSEKINNGKILTPSLRDRVIVSLILFLSLFIAQASGVYVQSNTDFVALQAKESMENSLNLREYLILDERNQSFLKSEIRLYSDSDLTAASNVDEDNGLRARLSNGRIAEIKIMPSRASAIAIARLNMNACSEENNCTIVLKETGNGSFGGSINPNWNFVGTHQIGGRRI